MHSYSTNAKDRESIPIYIAFVSVVFSLLLTSLFTLFKIQIPWWLDTPSVMGFYGIFYQIFETRIWSLNISNISFSSIPNLQGTWVGKIITSYDNQEHDEIILYIYQTWSSINIKLQTKSSTSYSTMARVNTLDSSEYTLKYEYLNEPYNNSLHTMSSHRGIANLNLSNDNQFLKGNYFTGRDRQNFGTMEFNFISNSHLSRDKAIEIFNKKNKLKKII